MRLLANNRVRSTLFSCGAVLAIASGAFGQESAGGSGSGGSGWQVTITLDGSDTYTYPIFDVVLNGYRMTTEVRDWATGNWTVDGSSVMYTGMSRAAWTTPVPYTGLAESKGSANIKVKWVGSGAAPGYCYLMLNSTAEAGDDPGYTPTVTVADGQGDPAVSIPGSKKSSGVHPRRLKLNGSGEAFYTLELNAKSTKTGTNANLYASSSISHDLNAKALSLFLETYKRTHVQAGDHETVHIDPAWTGNIENETAEIGINGGSFAPTVPVWRIGTWTSPGQNFSSTINPGYRIENSTGIPDFIVQSITCGGGYSNEQLVQMRQSPQTVTLQATQTDNGSLIHGPFASTLTFKVWAAERVIGLINRTVTTKTAYTDSANAPAGFFEVPYFSTGVTITLLHGTSWLIGGKVGLTRGVTLGFTVPELLSLGVKADTTAELNSSWTESNGVNLAVSFAPEAETYRVYLWRAEDHFNVERHLAGYGSAGFISDFFDVATDVKQPVGYIHWTKVTNW